MPEDAEKETITIADLDRIFFRGQDAQGKWKSLSAREATDAAFDTWAKSRLKIQGNDAPWTPQERADFCDMLWQQGALHILRREVPQAFQDAFKEKNT